MGTQSLSLPINKKCKRKGGGEEDRDKEEGRKEGTEEGRKGGREEGGKGEEGGKKGGRKEAVATGQLPAFPWAGDLTPTERWGAQLLKQLHPEEVEVEAVETG